MLTLPCQNGSPGCHSQPGKQRNPEDMVITLQRERQSSACRYILMGFFNSGMCFTEVGQLHVPRLTSVTPEHSAFRRSDVY